MRFCIVAAPIYIPTNSVQEFPFLPSLPTFVICGLFEGHQKSDFILMQGYLRENLRSRMILQEYDRKVEDCSSLLESNQ